MALTQYVGTSHPLSQQTIGENAQTASDMATGDWSKQRGQMAQERQREANVGTMSEALSRATRAGQNVIGGTQGVADKQRRSEVEAGVTGQTQAEDQALGFRLKAGDQTDILHQQQMGEKGFQHQVATGQQNYDLASNQQAFQQQLQQQQLALQQQQWAAKLAEQTAMMNAMQSAGMGSGVSRPTVGTASSNFYGGDGGFVARNAGGYSRGGV